MVKYIQKLLNILKMEMMGVWLMAGLSAVLGELDVIPNGWVKPASEEEFLLNLLTVILTIAGVLLAIRLFTLNTTKGLRRMNNEEALRSYHIWSVVRMGILCLVMMVGIVDYYLASSVSGVACSLIALCVTFYCWPSEAKISSYLAGVNNESE